MEKCETLGKRSSFLYNYENGILFIQFGIMKNPIKVNPDWIEKVKQRVVLMKYSRQTSLYNKHHWSECPNNRTCPYIASLIINGIIL